MTIRQPFVDDIDLEIDGGILALTITIEYIINI